MKEEQILNYKIEKLVGEGMTGAVYKAVDLISGQGVLIRQIHPFLIHNTPIKQNLQQHFDRIKGLRHPAISKMYAYTEQGDQLYIVSEYTEESKLSAYIHSGQQPISEETAWNIMMQLLDAFSYAHNSGVFHHSLSPERIVIDSNNKVKILDFGLAGLFTDASSDLRPTDVKLGDLQYQSPEQIYGKPADERSDVYSLGVILFELLTRQHPYPAVLSTYEIQTKIIKDSLPLIKLYTQNFSNSYRMQDIIDKATAKNPAYRFQQCGEFQENLQEEKDDREALIISQMMQDIAGKNNINTSIYENSTIGLAKKRTQWKVLTHVFLVISFLATAMIFTYWFRKSSDQNTALGTAIVKPSVSSPATLPEKKEPVVALKEIKKSPVKTNRAAQKINKPKQKQAIEIEQPSDSDENEIASAGIGMLPETRTKVFSATDLQIRLKHFYEALRSKNISRVEGYYAPTLTRFFNEYAVEEEQMKELIAKAWERTPEDDHEILWDTFRYYRDPKGNYIMDFHMNYRYRRENRETWRKRKIYTMIKMDKDLRIYYMDGD